MHVMVAVEDKHLNNKLPPSSSFLLAFVAEHGIIWCGISLWPDWVSCHGCVPSQPLAHPQHTGLWGGGCRVLEIQP